MINLDELEKFASDKNLRYVFDGETVLSLITEIRKLREANAVMKECLNCIQLGLSSIECAGRYCEPEVNAPCLSCCGDRLIDEQLAKAAKIMGEKE